MGPVRLGYLEEEPGGVELPMNGKRDRVAAATWLSCFGAMAKEVMGWMEREAA